MNEVRFVCESQGRRYANEIQESLNQIELIKFSSVFKAFQSKLKIYSILKYFF